MSELAGSRLYDYLLIESTGISEPLPVAQTFAFADSQGRRLDEVAQLDTMVTVVDSEARPMAAIPVGTQVCTRCKLSSLVRSDPAHIHLPDQSKPAGRS